MTLGGFDLHSFTVLYLPIDDPNVRHFMKVFQNVMHLWVNPRQEEESCHFPFKPPFFVVSFNLPSPFLTLSLRRMADIKFCSAAKSQVNLGLKLHGCLYEALIYPQRERGREVRT